MVKGSLNSCVNGIAATVFAVDHPVSPIDLTVRKNRRKHQQLMPTDHRVRFRDIRDGAIVFRNDKLFNLAFPLHLDQLSHVALAASNLDKLTHPIAHRTRPNPPTIIDRLILPLLAQHLAHRLATHRIRDRIQQRKRKLIVAMGKLRSPRRRELIHMLRSPHALLHRLILDELLRFEILEMTTDRLRTHRQRLR